MHVFLTGSSGYIGSAVAERLRAAGHRVTGLARSDAAASRLSAAGIQPIRGNFAEPRSINVAAGAADAVISMATTYDPDVDGPAIDAILTALAGSNKPMIYTSGIWSHGDTDGKVVDESSPPWPATLVQWRQAVEERVLDAAREGIRTVVIRPAIVYGRGGGIPAGFVDSTRNEGAARFVGTGLNRWPFVHVSKTPGRRSVPTPMRWCSISRPQVTVPRSSSAGARAGPISSPTSSTARIAKKDSANQAGGREGRPGGIRFSALPST